MKKTAIIVAGGSGSRMKSDIPKQFLPLAGRPILMHTIARFHKFDSQMKIVVVLPENQLDFWSELCNQHQFAIPHDVVVGGQTRFHSVLNGLTNSALEGVVAVHDGVRPLVAIETLRRCFALADESGAAIPVMQSKESVRVLDEHGRSRAVDRTTIRLVQTPQVFRAEVLLEAYQQPYNQLFTDDASVVEAAGYEVALTEGNSENIKLTTPDDLLFAEAVMAH